MWNSLFHIGIVFIFFQCAQGKTQGVVSHFAAKGHSNTIEYPIERRHRTRSDNDEELSQLRVRRETGGEPVAVQSSIPDDTHQYGRVSYSGEGSEVLYVVTYNLMSNGRVSSSRLYRSDDYGLNFTDQAEKLGSVVLNPNIYRFSSNNKMVIFADDQRNKIYVTADEGLTFDSYDVPVNQRILKPHPTREGWILGHDFSQGVLMYSEDLGANWDVVASSVHPPGYSRYLPNDYDWGEPGIDWNVDNPARSDITKVFYNVYDANVTLSINNRVFHVASNPGSGYTSQVFDCNLGHIDSFVLDGSYIFAGQHNTSNGNIQLHVSYMRNPFNLTRIPTTFSQFNYIVGSYRQSQALVIVYHGSHYTLYLSEQTGTYYSLSLEDLVVTNNGIDLEIISSINGTMIANQFALNTRRRTMISSDNGARWNKIASPDTNCMLPQCALHFHLDSSANYRRLGVYSRTSAPGIIVAHGNDGDYLTGTDISSYISRDGGLTWEQTLNSSWDIEIIDHGGLLVAARDDRQNNSMTIWYSCDEGLNWSQFEFIDHPVVVWSVITEPGQTTTQVLLFSEGEDSRNWIVIHVNFTSIFPRTCDGASDYYQWTVSDMCSLGETRIIERRKPSVCCWNSRQYERLISATPCQCTAADFECEWGYTRADNNSCVLDPTYGPKLDCLTGYRKIAGDVCVEGVSAQFLPPSGCVFDNSPKPDCDKGGHNNTSTNDTVTPVPDNGHNDTNKSDSTPGMPTATPMPDNGHNDSSNNDSSSSYNIPKPTTDVTITNGNRASISSDDDNDAAIVVPVIAVALLVIAGIIIVVVLGAFSVIRKRRTVAAVEEPDSIVRMPNEEVVGGHMKFKKLQEDE